MTDQTQQPPAAPAAEPEKKKPRKRSRALARRAAPPPPPVALSFDNSDGFALAQRRAVALAGSSVVPPSFRGPPGSEGYCNTLIALEIAHRLGYPPLLVMQNLTLVNSRPGWQGKFYIALIQSGNGFRDFEWEWKGEEGTDARGARFVATRTSDGKRCEGQWVDVRLAKAERWWSNVDQKGIERSKWPTMTDQMLVYRSAAFWTHQWNPGATLGIRSVEEVLDSVRAEEGRELAAPPVAPAFAPAGVTVPAAPRPPLEPEVLPPEPHVELDPDPLSPGVDVPSMNGPAAEIRRAIAEGRFPAALAKITTLAPGPEKEALKREYSEARKKSQR